MNEDNIDDFLGSNNEEKLKRENELLKLKMQAELGAHFHEESDISADMENMFLKNILAFHEAAQNQSTITIAEKLDNPTFIKVLDLSDTEIGDELKRLENLLNEHQIVVDYLGFYDDRTKYTFLTEELFNLEIDDMEMGEMKRHFIYEEFHPDHAADIKKQAESFINLWFNKTISADSWDLADQFILPEGKTKTKEEVVNQIHNIFSLSNGFINGRYDIIDVDFTLMDEDRGMGYAEGALGYRVILANGETEVVSGPFKLYFALEFGYWQIVHLIFPGFSY